MALRSLSALVFGAVWLGGCSVLPPQPLTHSTGFAPVYPVVREAPQQATGSLYNAAVGETFLGRGRNFQIGDVITVVLSESTQAARTQSGKLTRTSSNDVLPKEMGLGVSPQRHLVVPNVALCDAHLSDHIGRSQPKESTKL